MRPAPASKGGTSCRAITWASDGALEETPDTKSGRTLDCAEWNPDEGCFHIRDTGPPPSPGLPPPPEPLQPFVLARRRLDPNPRVSSRRTEPSAPSSLRFPCRCTPPAAFEIGKPL